jgi:CDP-diacylglycerol--glycerol-3-phosphate 3-phosphatidyltransferase
MPLQLYWAWNGKARVFLVCLVLQMLSDTLDGILARRLNQVSEIGAKLDSWADFAMYLSIPLCAWWLWPELIRAERPFLIASLVGYLVPIAFGFLKYRQLTSYHTWVSKLSSVLIPMGLLTLFCGGPSFAFHLAAVILIVSSLEEMLITALLPNWRPNVPSVCHAILLAKNGQADTSSTSPQS